MKVLELTLKKKWFDMIRCGIKKEEYRTIKPYWNTRLLNKSFDAIRFTNGYGKDKPSFVIELRELCSGLGIIEWGAPERVPVYILRLGKVLTT